MSLALMLSHSSVIFGIVFAAFVIAAAMMRSSLSSKVGGGLPSYLANLRVKGKHTNAATQRAVQIASDMVGLIQQKEAKLIDNPNVERVDEIMNLYRQAAEKFELAGDPRHAEVMAHMKRFLNQASTTSILNGSFVSESEAAATTTASSSILHKSAPAAVPQGEIIEQPKYNLSNDDDADDDIPPLLTESTSSSVTEDVQKCLQDEDDAIEASKDDGDFPELKMMFSEVDKELNDLLNSFV
eukprot:scaffold10284_cov61-Cyclotella_meneghiniana.AAC.5